MNYYKATIQYDGTGYAGFQWQKNIPSIQGDFNQALLKIVGGKLSTMGASRTDTGVHAMEQLVKITSQTPIECDSFLNKLNKELPDQIRCLNFANSKGNFRPELHAQSKEYRYFFTNFKKFPSFKQRFISNVHLPLDLSLMKICIPKIIGYQDFHNFYSAGSNIKSTTREIFSCELTEVNPHLIFNQSKIFVFPENLTQCYQFKIVGNGFLKQMVRHILSALWTVGSGRIDPEIFCKLLKGPKIEKRLWKVSPPNGLFLYKINYSPIDECTLQISN